MTGSTETQDAPDDTRGTEQTGQAGQTGPAEAAGGDGAAGPRPWRIRTPGADRWEVVLPLLLFVVVVLSGASTSSLGATLFREDPKHFSGTMIGEPLSIRSDEWLAQTPIELAVLANGSSMRSPLAQEPDLIYQISSGGWFGQVLFWDGNLLRLGPWLPDAQLFAAFRFLPTLLLLLALPPLMRRLGATRSMSWLAVILTVLAPASAWWSFMPVRILGFGAAGCYLLFLARDRLQAGSRLPALALAALAGLLTARLASYYVPWSLVIGIPLVLATGVCLAWSTTQARKAGWLVIGAGAVAGGLALGGMLFDNAAALHAELNTAYPGLRRITGAVMSPMSLFAAPGLRDQQDSATELLIGNRSENSSAYLLCLLWATMLWRRMRPVADTGQRAGLVTMTVAVWVWFSWVVINWGALGSHVPVMNLVPTERVVQTLGIPAGFVLCLVLSRVESVPWRSVAAVSAACGLLTLHGVSDLVRAMPSVSVTELVVTALLTAAVVAVVTRWRNRWAVAVALVATAVVALPVNPVVFGLGELRSGDTAATAGRIAERAGRSGTTVATDTLETGALMVANGAPMLTGYQVTGPVRRVWDRLDPDRKYEETWNRGASYVVMAFDAAPGAAPTMSNPNNDIIAVSVDPCSLAARPFRLGYVVASGEIGGYDCLTPETEFTWAGITRYVYRVR